MKKIREYRPLIFPHLLGFFSMILSILQLNRAAKLSSVSYLNWPADWSAFKQFERCLLADHLPIFGANNGQT